MDQAKMELLASKALALSMVVILILVLSRSMEDCGRMKRLLESFQGLIRHPGLNLVFFPAIIGLLPMPGGAIFSAPMVKSIGGPRNLSGAQMSFINYWFRHIWEYWWPLYPGVLLTTALARLDLWTYVLCLFPLTVVAVAAGCMPVRKTFETGEGSLCRVDSTDRNIARFMVELIPILISIAGGLGLGALFSLAPDYRGWNISKESGLIVALVAAIWWVWRKDRVPMEKRRDILTDKDLFKMFFMIAAILIFQGTLEKSGAVGMLTKVYPYLLYPCAALAISAVLYFFGLRAWIV